MSVHVQDEDENHLQSVTRHHHEELPNWVTSRLQRRYHRYHGGNSLRQYPQEPEFDLLYCALLFVAVRVERLEFGSQSFIKNLKLSTEKQKFLDYNRRQVFDSQ